MRYHELEEGSRLKQLVDITAKYGTDMRRKEDPRYVKYKALCDATILEQKIEGKFIYQELNKIVDQLVIDKTLDDIDEFDWSLPKEEEA